MNNLNSLPSSKELLKTVILIKEWVSNKWTFWLFFPPYLHTHSGSVVCLLQVLPGSLHASNQWPFFKKKKTYKQLEVKWHFYGLCFCATTKKEKWKMKKGRKEKNTFHLHSMEFLGQACRVASKHSNQWKNNHIIVLGQSSREWNHSGINPCLFHPFYACFYSSITLDFPKESTENMTGYQRVCYKISDLLTCVSLSGSTLRLRWRYIRIIWRVARGGGVNVKAGLRTMWHFRDFDWQVQTGNVATSGMQLPQLHCGRRRGEEAENNLSCDESMCVWSSKAPTRNGWGQSVCGLYLCFGRCSEKMWDW